MRLVTLPSSLQKSTLSPPYGSSLRPELVGRDGHALLGAHVELALVELGAKGVHEGHGLALVPAVEQVERGGGEDRADGVDHALEHDEEHGSGATHLLALVHFHLVSVGLQTLGLVCKVSVEKQR